MATKQKLNTDWHKQNRMPEKATLEQCIAWHLEHRKYCGCRDIPEKLKTEMKKRNIKY
ncbi:hypothetical protein [Panacibacter ginsenosidivorans]|uniref:hypothetical protein n=1 Tax=Panacibacter ginsenosidivorans TaxID=1813871 RepID=UPI0018640FA6|nr:hypothetical protein [Panacibacter ginsenosidivorans]